MSSLRVVSFLTFFLSVVYVSGGTLLVEVPLGQPLFLTPYIEEDRIYEGRKAAKVTIEDLDVDSYSGYLTVNKTCNSNLFFWYFLAETDPERAPVVLWLQGGPGASSMNGLFNENGPFFIDESGSPNIRDARWSKKINLIYIDNPVGTGFSFTDKEVGYAKDEVDVGRDLYSAIHQFLQLFPNLQTNELFLAGESYAGKYVPAAAYAIHTNNKVSSFKINLKGLAMGDGWTAPEYMLDYGEYLYHVGLIDGNGKIIFSEKKEEALRYIQQKEYIKAKDVVDLMVSDFNPQNTLYYNMTGLTSCYNYITNNDFSPDFTKYLLSEDVRQRIHVGSQLFLNGDKAAMYLEGDVMQSVKLWIEDLIEEYRILFYNGQLDIICAYPLTVNVLQHLNWSGRDLYETVERKKWMVDGALAGYSKTVKGMTELLVRNAGHMIPKDQPKWAFELINTFVFEKYF